MTLRILNSETNQHILRERKRDLAREKKEVALASADFILTFLLSNEQVYAFPYEEVLRIIPKQKITLLPQSEAFFLGLIYYNTETWPLVHTGNLLYGETYNPEIVFNHFILCKKGTDRLAFAVNDILGLIPFDNEQALTKFSNETSPYVKGIYQSNTTILELSTIFNRVMQKN